MTNYKKYDIYYLDNSMSTSYMQNKTYYEQLEKQGVGKIDKDGQCDVFSVTLAQVVLPVDNELKNLDVFVISLNKIYKFNYLFVFIDDKERIEYRFDEGNYDMFSEKVRY